MESLSLIVRRWPRFAAAIAFGGVTAIVVHFAWFPHARYSGAIPGLTIAAGVAHALSGAVMGPYIVRRTRNSLQAVWLGASTSLLALMLFAPPFAIWVNRMNTQPGGVISRIGLMLLVALFTFLAVGWALLLVSALIGWSLYRLASSDVRDSSSDSSDQ